MVMITAFAVIYSITFGNMQKQNVDTLHSLANKQENLAVSDAMATAEVHIENNLPAEYMLSFSLKIDADGEIIEIDSLFDLPKDVYQKAANLAWKRNGNDDTVTIDGTKWLYSLTSIRTNKVSFEGRIAPSVRTDTHYQMTFLDVTGTYETLSELLITFLLVGLAMLVSFSSLVSTSPTAPSSHLKKHGKSKNNL